MTDDECFTQIKEYFALFNETIDDITLANTLNKMLDDGLIVLKKEWKNEKNEYPYSLTDIGKRAWSDNLTNYNS